MRAAYELFISLGNYPGHSGILLIFIPSKLFNLLDHGPGPGEILSLKVAGVDYQMLQGALEPPQVGVGKGVAGTASDSREDCFV